MKRLYLFLFLFLFLMTKCYYQVNGFVRSDADFFDALNIDYPGLEQVKKCLARGDYFTAKREYVAYIKARRTPKWYIDWRDFAPEKNKNSIKPNIIAYADRHVNNELLAQDVWYKYGDTIDFPANVNFRITA